MNLRTLDENGSDLPHIPVEVLIQAVTKLENFSTSTLRPSQVTAVLTRLSVGNHKLRRLSLPWINLTSVPTDVLVAVISGLVEVGLRETQLTTRQLTGIFTMLSTMKEHQLRKLDLTDNDLSSVPADILVAGISLRSTGWWRTEDVAG